MNDFEYDGKQLVDRITWFCKMNRITRIKLAEQTGIPESTVRGWRENKKPAYEAVYKIAQFFGVTTEFLYFGFDPNSLDNNFAPIKLSLLEQEIIETFRSLSIINQQSLYDYVRYLGLKSGKYTVEHDTEMLSVADNVANSNITKDKETEK